MGREEGGVGIGSGSLLKGAAGEREIKGKKRSIEGSEPYVVLERSWRKRGNGG